MRNWSKPKRTPWQSLNVEATKTILRLADLTKCPYLQPPEFEVHRDLLVFWLKWYLKIQKTLPLRPEELKLWFKSLDRLVSRRTLHRHLRPSKGDLVEMPSGLEITLAKIGFSDLFFPEEFVKLQYGLNRMLSDYPSPLGSYDKNQLNEWFSSVQNSEYKAATINVGFLLFNNKGSALSKSFQSANIQLKYIAPSYICLSALFKPSEKLTQKFNTLLKTIPCPQSEISGFGLRRGITSIKTTPALRTRKAELEKLFLEINKDVVLLFRQNLGVGLSQFGPLPCVEILSTNISLKEIPEDRYPQKASEALKACCSLWESLGYPFELSLIYSKADWWKLYEVRRSELFYQKSYSYQILVSLVDYEKPNYNQESHYSIEREVSYTTHGFLQPLALRHFYKVLESRILDLRTDLAPSLSNQTKGTINVRRLKSGISKMIKLNGLYFQHLRLSTAAKEKTSLNYLYRGVEAISRIKYHEDDSGLLRNDFKYSIDQARRNCEEQLNLLRLSYEQVLSYKTTISNYRIQQATFLLSIVVAILTVITIIPEKSRIGLIIDIWTWLNNFQR